MSTDPAEARPGVCPTCSSAQPHLHPTRDLCPDVWHKPVPATSGEWRAEMSRWAGLVEQIADGAGDMDALLRVAAGMRDQAAAATPGEPSPPAEPDAHDRFCDGTCKRKRPGDGWTCPDPYGPNRALLSGGEQT